MLDFCRVQYRLPYLLMMAAIFFTPLAGSAATTLGTNSMTSDGDLTIRGNVTLKDAVPAADTIDIGDTSDTVTIAGDLSLTDTQWNVTSAGAASFATLTSTAQTGLSLNPFGAAAGNTGEIRFLELAANGANYAAFKSPDLLAANVTWTLPSADGTVGQVLSTNGAGVLSWATGGSGITSLGGQTGATQTFANDTNVTITSATNTHTLGWAGTLSVARGGTGAATAGAARASLGAAASGANSDVTSLTGLSSSGLALGTGVNATTFTSTATAARAISFPNVSGTVALTSDIAAASGWTDDGAAVRLTTASDNIAIGTATALGKLRVLDGAVLFDGVTGATPASGAGTRFMWIPAKAAIRAGLVGADQWDDVKIGAYSAAFGADTTASGNRSAAFNDTTTASGAASAAFGDSTIAGSYASAAFGFDAIASGDISFAAGQNVTVGPAANTIALGLGVSNLSRLVNNTARSLMVGFNSTTPTVTVMGLETTGSPTLFKVTGQAHTTLTATVESPDVDIDLNRTVQFTGSVTPGAANIATQRAAIFRAPTYAFSSTGAQIIANAATLAITGAPVAGTNATITNPYAFWVQGGNTRLDNSSVLFSGTTGSTPASGAGTRFMWIPAKSAIRVGLVAGTQWDDSNIGTTSVAFGDNTVASGIRSTAFGVLTNASGIQSTAFGNGTTASANASTAFGTGTVASGVDSFAAGRFVTAGAAANTIALGLGVDLATQLVNNTMNSMMVGFNSDIPTLFVGPSAGLGTTGDVGIGTSTPGAKLDVAGSLKVGVGGTPILKHLSVSTPNVGTLSIGASSCGTYSVPIAVTGAALGDTVVATPTPVVTTGIENFSLSWNAYVWASGSVYIRACNPTAGAIDTADTQTWRVDVWQH